MAALLFAKNPEPLNGSAGRCRGDRSPLPRDNRHSHGESGHRRETDLKPGVWRDISTRFSGMSQGGDPIDFGALERELRGAVEAQNKYERENSAKLRAVQQGVSYEQFRNLVLCSHLQPLEKKDIHGGAPKQPWNPTAPRKA